MIEYHFILMVCDNAGDKIKLTGGVYREAFEFVYKIRWKKTTSSVYETAVGESHPSDTMRETSLVELTRHRIRCGRYDYTSW